MTKNIINDYETKFPFEKISKITLLGYTGFATSGCLKTSAGSTTIIGQINSVLNTLTYTTDFGLYDLTSLIVGQSC